MMRRAGSLQVQPTKFQAAQVVKLIETAGSRYAPRVLAAHATPRVKRITHAATITKSCVGLLQVQLMRSQVVLVVKQIGTVGLRCALRLHAVRAIALVKKTALVATIMMSCAGLLQALRTKYQVVQMVQRLETAVSRYALLIRVAHVSQHVSRRINAAMIIRKPAKLLQAPQTKVLLQILC